HRQHADCRHAEARDADVEVVADVEAAAGLAEIEVGGFDREVLVEAVATEDLEAGVAVVEVDVVETVVIDLRGAEAGARIEARLHFSLSRHRRRQRQRGEHAQSKRLTHCKLLVTLRNAQVRYGAGLSGPTRNAS